MHGFAWYVEDYSTRGSGTGLTLGRASEVLRVKINDLANGKP